MPSLSFDKAELQHLTETLVRVLNSRDFNFKDADGKEIISHVAPNFEGRFDTHPHTISWAEQVDIWTQDAIDHPKLHFEVLDMSVHVRRRSQTASVFLKLALTGMGGEGVQYQGACELKWRWEREVWLLSQHVTMRGPLVEGMFP